MAISLILNSIGTTYVTLQISGLDYTYYPYKRITIKDSNTDTTLGSPNYFTADTFYKIYTTDDIFQPGTSYSIYVNIQRWISDYGDWSLQGGQSSNVISFTTNDDGGGGGGDDPSFTAEVYSNNNIYVQISDLNHYDRTYFYLWNHGDHSSPLAQSPSNWNTLYYDFQNLSSGYYDISVKYRYNGQYHQIYTSSGWEYFSLQITGGGGSTSWSYPTTDFIQKISSNTSRTYSVNSYEGVEVLVTFADTETISLSVSGSAVCEVYLTGETSFDSDTGIPINGGGTYYGGGSQITNISVNAYPSYYLIWIKGVNGQVSGSVTLTISLNVTPPSSDSYVYIYTGSGSNQGWKKAIPYIYTGSGSGQGWKQAQAYIFNGSAWKKTTE